MAQVRHFLFLHNSREVLRVPVVLSGLWWEFCLRGITQLPRASDRPTRALINSTNHLPAQASMWDGLRASTRVEYNCAVWGGLAMLVGR